MSLIRPITPMEYSRDPFGVFFGCGHKLLAQGDSWFSIGTLNPFNSNLLFEIDTPTQVGAVNCAYPGRTLAHMVDQVRDKTWLHLLNDKSDNWHWDALLFSAGGNDLIDAVQSTYEAAGGDPAKRLLLREEEWNPQRPVPQRYFSEPGWNTFVAHMSALLEHLVALRDSPRSAAAGAPLFLHTYHVPTPRDAPALPGIAGPWLYKAVTAYAIPPADWNALADELISRLAALLKGVAATLPQVHVFDSAQLPLERAEAGATGPSGDWVNEIHLTRRGYRKLGAPLGRADRGAAALNGRDLPTRSGASRSAPGAPRPQSQRRGAARTAGLTPRSAGPVFSSSASRTSTPPSTCRPGSATCAMRGCPGAWWR